MGRILALTFDDAPGEGTAAILDLLAKAGAKATFFVEGRRAEDAEGAALVRRMVAEGHVAGNHGYSHARPEATEDYLAELARTDAILARLGAQEPVWHRLPYGLLEPDSRARDLDRAGRSSIGWSVDSEDWRAIRAGVRGGADRIEEMVTLGLASHPPGPAIVLFHNHALSAAALARLLERWRPPEYALCTLDELPRDALFAPHVRHGHLPARR